MSEGLGECCISGHLHAGTPKGTITEIAGLKTYVTKPANGSKDMTILYISDIFGYELPNAQLLADQYAMAGFYVYIPDFLQGDPLNFSILPKLAPTKQQAEGKTQEELSTNLGEAYASMGPWLSKHNVETAYPLIQNFLSHLRADRGHKKIGAVGFCWGGKFAVLLTHQNANPMVDAAVALHPSLLSLPEDIEKITRPTAIGVGDADFLLPMSDAERIQDIFQGKEGCELDIYPDQVHGFAVRGDLTVDSDRQAAAKAAERTVAFFEKYLA